MPPADCAGGFFLPMLILITGANGFLGQHLCQHFSTAYKVIATGRGERRLPSWIDVDYHSADITNAKEVEKLLALYKPNILIHNAAMSKPDECKQNKDGCIAANVESTRHLLAFPVSHFIYISTDFVFGENGPHAEDAPTEPLNYYGQTKLQAEQLVMQATNHYSIVRPVFIYGQMWEGVRGSFLHWVVNNLKAGKPIKVVSDQQRTPTYAPDICEGIQSIIKKQAFGAYHLAGANIVSPYEMAVAVAKILHLDESLIEPVTANTFVEPVKRAKRSGLTIEKARRELGYEPVSFEEGLRLTFASVTP